MCGFTGFSFRNESLLKSMGKKIKYRAIDEEYYYFNKFLSFYHAHLSIEDIDKDTSQPLIYNNFIIGLVGEIYNKEYILKLVGKLGQYTELEVIGFAYEKFGSSFIDIINGEFAIFIFDINLEKYFLYRDRWGTNNIYYKVKDKNLYFGSEIKTLITDKPRVNKRAFIEFMVFQFCISPNTLFDGIKTLRPGTFLEFHNGKILIHNFGEYKFQEDNNDIIQGIKKSIIRRIPKFQKKIFISLSGGLDSTLILYFLNRYYKGEIITYSFQTTKNKKEILIAKRNTRKLGIKHLIIDMESYNFPNLENDIYIHEGLVILPNLERIVKEKFPQYSNIKVEFGGDGKEELFLGNNHFPYKDIILRYRYFRNKNLINKFFINQEFLNKELFDYNLQMIDKITLSNGIERRMPFTDYELIRFYKKSNYRSEAKSFLFDKGLEIVDREYGYNLGIGFNNLYDQDLLSKKNILFNNFNKKNVV